MNFTYFKGNENVKARVSSLFESSRLPHAILIEGETGLGKKRWQERLPARLYAAVRAKSPAECVLNAKKL